MNFLTKAFILSPSRLIIIIKALRELGFTQVVLNGLYRLALKAGYYRYWIFENRISNIQYLFPFPSRDDLLQIIGPDGLQALLSEAGEIVAGKFRQFGGDPVEINLAPSPPLALWTEYEGGKTPFTLSPSHLQPSDIKLIWEPARFGWAFVLGRAYHATGDEQYPAAFWRYFEIFQAANAPALGPNWMSGQEVGIRLMAFVWAAQVFADASATTPQRLHLLTESITHHALRIPPTLLYARSQNNNHLLTEAAALYTASLALPTHPQAAKWRSLGQKWLDWCFTQQIDEHGEYVQHSTNYHRLMLQTALWVRTLENGQNPMVHGELPVGGPRSTVGPATRWLLSLLDSDSGRVPNLGANDGALIFPLSTCPFDDFRPVAQAAARAFLGANLPPGPWDEMSLWFGLPPGENPLPRDERLRGRHSWGYLRAVKLTSRPSHADQLHFDLWWRGLNVAQDAGTYLYNAAPPWDNRLTSTLVHNTVSVDGLEQMTRAGRFLYLDWADAIVERHPGGLRAQTDAYARLGVRHERLVTVSGDDCWLVEDKLRNLHRRPHVFRLHWLLPDWEYEVRYSIFDIRLKSPHGWITLRIQPQNPNIQASNIELSNITPRISLVRAGEYLLGPGQPDPVRGWVSPTYGQKIPALSLAIEVEAGGDVKFTSEFKFPTPDGER